MSVEMKKTGIAGIIFVTGMLALLVSVTPVFAQADDPAGMEDYWKPIGAGLAMGAAGLGAALGMGIASSAAFAAMVDRPEIFSNAILLIVLIEAVAIYGLVVAFMILII